MLFYALADPLRRDDGARGVPAPVPGQPDRDRAHADAPRGRSTRRRRRAAEAIGGGAAAADPARDRARRRSCSACGRSSARRRGWRRTCERADRRRARRARGAARARRRARARARRADRARERRGRRGAGARVLARPLAPRPQRADGASPARPSSARRCASCARSIRAAPRCSSASCSDERRRSRSSSPSWTGRATCAELLDGGARAGPRRRAARRSTRARATARRSIARAAGASVLEIPPRGVRSRAHAQPRAPSARAGELICFLTQDATPLPGWLDALRGGVRARRRRRRRVRPAPAAAGHVGDDRARADRVLRRLRARRRARRCSAPDDAMFLSNVNACYRRACWEEIRFDDVALLRGPGVRARDAGAPAGGAPTTRARRCCTRTTTRRSASCAATSTSTAGCARRAGTSSAIGVRSTRARRARRSSPPTGAGCASRAGRRASARAATGRSARAPRDAQARRRARLARAPAAGAGRSGRSRSRGAAPPRRRPARSRPCRSRPRARGRASTRSPSSRARAPCRCCDPVPGMADAERLHIAVVIPPFRRGSGGHSTIYNLLTRLEERGHTVSTWLYDPRGRHAQRVAGGRSAATCASTSARSPGRCSRASTHWYGADVVLATGWDTVYAGAAAAGLPRPRLPRAGPRAGVLRHLGRVACSPSAPTREGLYCIAASPWLRDLVRAPLRRARRARFELGVDHDVYRPRAGRAPRRHGDLLRARRHAAARRAARRAGARRSCTRRRPDAALRALRRRRAARRRRSPYEHLGVASPEELVVGLLRGDRRALAVADELLADPAGDAGLRAAVRRARRRAASRASSAPTGRSSSRRPTRSRSPTRSSGCSTTRRCASAAPRDGLEFVAEHDVGPRRRRRSRTGCATALRARERRAAREPPSGPCRAGGAVPQPRSAERARRPGRARREPARRPSGCTRGSTPEDVAAVERAARRRAARYWDARRRAHRRTLALDLRRLARGPGACSRRPACGPTQPPEDVHAMARGPLAGRRRALLRRHARRRAARASARDLDDVERGLDFGCSSGRVVRALAAAYPEAEWHGVRPERGRDRVGARAPAGDRRSRVSPQDPPLPYDDGALRLRRARSRSGRTTASTPRSRWLEEMHRIIRPGGRLVLSTHGLHSVAYYAQTGERSPAQLAQIRTRALPHGLLVRARVRRGGRLGRQAPEWGTAFFTPEWLARVALPAWSIEDFAVGQNADNQDMYVLRRR